MTVRKTDIPEEANTEVTAFARFLEESKELNNEINTSVDISVVIPESGGGNTPESSNQHVKVEEYGNDGYELVPQYEDGNIVGYEPEGTSKVGQYVQELADEFFGFHEYRCGFYEDEQCSETTIVP